MSRKKSAGQRQRSERQTWLQSAQRPPFVWCLAIDSGYLFQHQPRALIEVVKLHRGTISIYAALVKQIPEMRQIIQLKASLKRDTND